MLNSSLGLGFVLQGKDMTGPMFKSVRDKFAQIQVQARRLKSQTQDTLGGLFRAQGWDRLKVGFREAGAAAERFRKQVQGIRGDLVKMHERGTESRGKVEGVLGDVRGSGLKAAAVGGAGLGAAGLLAKQSGDMSMALAQFKVVSGGTAAELEQVRQKALEMGYSTKYAGSESVNALTDISSAGFNAVDSMDLLKPALDLATASLGQLTASEAAGTTAQTLKAFGINAKEAGPAVDKLAATMNLFAIQAKDLPLGLANSVRGASAMGQSLDETLITLGLIKNIIPRTETAATAASVAMERMVNPEVQKSLRTLGVEATDASTGGFRKFLDVLGDLEPQLAKMSDSKSAAFLQDTFGPEALTGINAIFTQVRTGITTSSGAVLKGSAAFEYLRREMRNSQGTAASFADEMNKTLPGGIDRLKASWKTAMEELGDPFEQAFKPAVEQVRAGIKWVTDEIRGMSPEARRFAASAFLVASGVMAVVGGLTAAGAAFQIWRAGMAAVQATSMMTVATMLPAVLIFGALAIAAYGFKRAIDKNVGGSADKLKQFADAAEWLKAKALAVWDAVSQFAEGAADGFSTFVPAILDAFGELGGAFREFGSDVFGGSEDADRFKTAGQKVGAVVAKLAIGLIKAVTVGVRFADMLYTGGKAAYSLLDKLGILNFVADNATGIITGLIALKVGSWAAGIATAMSPLAIKVMLVTAAFLAVASAIDQAMKLYNEWDENSGSQLSNELQYRTGIISGAEYSRRMNERQGIKSEYGTADTAVLDRNLSGEGARVYNRAEGGILGGAAWRASEIARSQVSQPPGPGPDMSKIDAAAGKLERAAASLSKQIKVDVSVEQQSQGVVSGAYNIE